MLRIHRCTLMISVIVLAVLALFLTAFTSILPDSLDLTSPDVAVTQVDVDQTATVPKESVALAFDNFMMIATLDTGNTFTGDLPTTTLVANLTGPDMSTYARPSLSGSKYNQRPEQMEFLLSHNSWIGAGPGIQPIQME